MDKEQLVNSIIEMLQREFEKISSIAEETRQGSIGGEAKQESKYDTRAIEAGYLAGAQAKRVAEIEIDINLLKTLKVRSFTENDVIMVGAVVIVQDEDGLNYSYFISPGSGGISIELNNSKLQVISSNSPMGAAMLNLEVDDSFIALLPSGNKEFVITEVI